MNAKKPHVGDATFSRYIRFMLKQAFKGKPSKQLELVSEVEKEADV